MSRRILLAVLTMGLLLASAVIASAGGGGGASVSITVTGTSDGVTQLYTGGTEGSSRFNAADMVDIGVNEYRIWADMARFEPTDDDGVYGSPTIAQIKANPNVINWSAWDYQFNRLDPFFFKGTSLINQITNMSTAQILASCRANNIHVTMSPHVYIASEGPTWIPPIPVRTVEGQNEWWEYVFALCYYCNVLHDWGIDYWEIENEPDLVGGGWADQTGTAAEYGQLVQLSADAINYVYSTYLNNREHYIGAPVAADNQKVGTWGEAVADAYYDVADFHSYSFDLKCIPSVNQQLDTYDTDGIHEPLWISEWGHLTNPYTSLDYGTTYSAALIYMNQKATYVLGSDLYNMWPWERANGTVAPYLVWRDGTYTELAYAFKTALKALKGGKPRYVVTGSLPRNGNLTVISTKDASGLYICVSNMNFNTSYTINANISAHRMTGTGTVYEYSATRKCAVASNPVVNNGRVSFSSPGLSTVTLWVP